jgi:hypothetical protein
MSALRAASGHFREGSGHDVRRGAVPALLFGAGIAAGLLVLQALIGNVHIATANGLWKSIPLGAFISDPGWHRLDPSNALYYPVYAALCRGLDMLGVFPGLRWRQMAVLNAGFAGVVGAVSFAFVLAWTGSRRVALLSALAYCFSGYVLLLGLINEDIMPGFSLVFAATLMAAGWFSAPTPARIALVAIVFSAGWLFEWRLLFPSLPPLLLALVLADGRPGQRILRPILFIGAMAIAPALIALAAGLSGRGISGALDLFATLFWTGKGVGSGWAGFTTDKLWLWWSGAAGAVFSSRHIMDAAWFGGPHLAEVLLGSVLGFTLAAICIAWAMRRHRDPRVRVAIVVVGGTFACGVVFNLYSQPQDPQMQVNVMTWTLFGWALLFGWLRCAAPGAPGLLLSLLCLAVPASWSLAVSAEDAGLDHKRQALVLRLEQAFNPSQHVFLWRDWDGVITWLAATWENTVPTLGQISPAPSDRPKFKLIGLIRPSVEQRGLSGEQHAGLIVVQIDRALALGYRVVTPDFWNADEATWVAEFSTVVGAAATVEIRRRLHEAFTARQVWEDPLHGPWFEIRRHAP